MGLSIVLCALVGEVAAQSDAAVPSGDAIGGAAAVEMAARSLNPKSITPEVTAVRTRIATPNAGPLTADGRPLTELAGVSYRVWMSHGRADWGVGVGALGYVLPGPDGRMDGARSVTGTTPTVSVALRYRMSKESSVFADASGTRGLVAADPNVGSYNTKVGVEWKPAKSRLGFDGGAIGLHLDSGYRVSFKAKRGGLGVYLRGQF